MSERSVKVLLEDIQDCLDKIFDYTHGLDESQFKGNSMVVDAVLRNIEVMGEAASKLPDDFIREHPDVEWHKIIGMRNRLIHGYFGVSLQLVWQTIRHNLPELQVKLGGLSK